ncbi:hypothetical protein Hanom_Chr15g01410331 [Helianthus anomalus]
MNHGRFNFCLENPTSTYQIEGAYFEDESLALIGMYSFILQEDIMDIKAIGELGSLVFIKQGALVLWPACEPLWRRNQGPHEGIQVRHASILPQVQVEAFLWGLGITLGKLPPYFIQERVSSLSGEIVDAAEELDASSSDNHGFASILNRLKRWFLSHAQ